MKDLTITVKEKRTENIALNVTILGVPETLEEIHTLTQADQADRAMSYFTSGLEASAKSRLEDGEKISYNDLLQRSGRRTQTGLVQAIMGLIPDAATVGAAEEVGELVKLQLRVMQDYKGNGDELYREYRGLYDAVQAVKAEAEAE